MTFLEPVIGDRDHRDGRAEDHVEEAIPAPDLRDPALVLDLGLEALLLEVQQDAREVARLAEDVEILGRAVDAGIAVDGERAGDQAGDLAFGQDPQRIRVEGVGVGRSQVGHWRRRASQQGVSIVLRHVRRTGSVGA